MNKKINECAIRYGNKDGELKFGHITDSEEVDAFIVRSGTESNHYIEMCSTGNPHLKHGTICRSTGSFQIKAGDNVKSSGKSKTNENYAVYIEAVDGDIVLNAPRGRIKLAAQNIDLIANGFDGKNGNINASADEKIILNSKGTIDISAGVSAKLFSNDTVNVIGKAILNIYGGLIDAADGATSKNGSKGGSKNEDNQKK
jgi:hypothetical protein